MIDDEGIYVGAALGAIVGAGAVATWMSRILPAWIAVPVGGMAGAYVGVGVGAVVGMFLGPPLGVLGDAVDKHLAIRRNRKTAREVNRRCDESGFPRVFRDES